ncbi:thioesterase family protein [Psychrobium sp. MM17-31]|uniref:thioesterase family protein n=1 Tax=Psychrobium sp. MM17-31 TaxID=2917758 RepID=UPI001EF3DB9D|nr:thioesterase family protein [Psychrobium sp. MM17-31]MCG7533007.1 thioesterase family protein [Psychrobium sp. MM17-31]
MSEQLQTQEVRDIIKDIFDRQMPYHQLIGLNISCYENNKIELKIAMKPELVGNIMHGILHGGVTASMLDVAGGMIVFSDVLENMEDLSKEAVMKRLQNLGTIDLRIDYLRPGRGEEFTATATVIRTGNKVAVARMELHNEKGDHIAFGTGTYMVG